MKKKILLAVLAVSLALNAGVLCTVGFHWIQHRCMCRGDGPWHRKHFQKELRLNDAQSRALEKGRDRLKATIDPLQARLRTKKMELMTLLRSTDTYTPQIDALVNENSALQLEIEKTFIRHSFDVRRELSPEQQRKFNDMLEKGFRRMGPHDGPGPEGPHKFPKQGH